MSTRTKGKGKQSSHHDLKVAPRPATSEYESDKESNSGFPEAFQRNLPGQLGFTVEPTDNDPEGDTIMQDWDYTSPEMTDTVPWHTIMPPEELGFDPRLLRPADKTMFDSSLFSDAPSPRLELPSLNSVKARKAMESLLSQVDKNKFDGFQVPVELTIEESQGTSTMQSRAKQIAALFKEYYLETGGKFYCRYTNCDSEKATMVGFYHKSNCRRHINTCHLERWTCTFCGRVCQGQPQVDKHIQDVHSQVSLLPPLLGESSNSTDGPPSEEPVWNATKYSTSLSKRHPKALIPYAKGRPFGELHSDRQGSNDKYCCDLEGCDRTRPFSSQDLLKKHLKETHLAGRLYFCPIVGCERHIVAGSAHLNAFINKDHVVVHLKQEHPEVTLK